MRAWLIGGNLFLGGILATLLLAGPFMRGSAATHTAAQDESSITVPAASKTESVEEDPVVGFALGIAIDTLRDMKNSTRDPRSTRFRNLWAVNIGTPEEPLVAVCGEVNAQNGFGGFTGFTPFILAGAFVMTPSDAGFQRRFVQNCAPERRITPVSF